MKNTRRLADVIAPSSGPLYGPTKGHCEGNGGLRGHSVGDIFPARVVAMGSPHDNTLQWYVAYPDGTLSTAFTRCKDAHSHALVWRNGQ